MDTPEKDRRKSNRFDTEVKIYFDIPYDIETKVEYRIEGQGEQNKQEDSSKKYLAISRNVSTEGICFISKHKLEVDTALSLEVFVPSSKEPVHMKGSVRWSKPGLPNEKSECQFESGVKLTEVEGDSVFESIYFDETYKVEWSVVLQSILGNFRILAQKKEDDSV